MARKTEQDIAEWGEFPQTTQEEITVERKLRKLHEGDIAVGKSLADGRSMNTQAKRLKQEFDNEETAPNAEAKLYGILQATIESKSKLTKNLVLKALQENNIFKRMGQASAFALAVECVRSNDPLVLGVMVGSIKKEQPFNPDLTTRKAASGMTLGHYAARCDHPAILKELQKINVTCLATENNNRENVAHTASRFGAWHCLDQLVESQPQLFARANKTGQTPLDLEGGRLIRTKINLEQAQAAEREAACKQDASRKVLQEASRKGPAEPLFSVSKETVKTKPGPSMRM